MTQLELHVHEHSGMSSYLCLLPAEAMALLATKMSFSDPSLALYFRVKRSDFHFCLLHNLYHPFSFGCSSCWSLPSSCLEAGVELDVAQYPEVPRGSCLGWECGMCCSIDRH